MQRKPTSFPENLYFIKGNLATPEGSKTLFFSTAVLIRLPLSNSHQKCSTLYQDLLFGDELNPKIILYFFLCLMSPKRK